MRNILITILICISYTTYSQQQSEEVDIDANQSPKPKPEIFTKGSFDMSVNGQINATARLIKLNIGEPNKFNVPAALFVGVTTRAIGSYQQNDELLQNFINPYSGLLSFCIDDERRFRKKIKNTTGFSVVYQLGLKMLNGYDSANKKFTPFHSNFANAGFGFITQAWERQSEYKMKRGYLWVNAKLHFTKLPQTQVQKIVNKQYQSELLAYSILAGIDIDKSINFKFSYYKYIQNPIKEKVQPLVQATLNYSFNN